MSHLAVVRGAPHTAMIWPRDDTTARGFLDPPNDRPAEEVIRDIGDAVLAFAGAMLRPTPTGQQRVAELLGDEDRYARHAVR